MRTDCGERGCGREIDIERSAAVERTLADFGDCGRNGRVVLGAAQFRTAVRLDDIGCDIARHIVEHALRERDEAGRDVDHAVGEEHRAARTLRNSPDDELAAEDGDALGDVVVIRALASEPLEGRIRIDEDIARPGSDHDIVFEVELVVFDDAVESGYIRAAGGVVEDIVHALCVKRVAQRSVDRDGVDILVFDESAAGDVDRPAVICGGEPVCDACGDLVRHAECQGDVTRDCRVCGIVLRDILCRVIEGYRTGVNRLFGEDDVGLGDGAAVDAVDGDDGSAHAVLGGDFHHCGGIDTQRIGRGIRNREAVDRTESGATAECFRVDPGDGIWHIDCGDRRTHISERARADCGDIVGDDIYLSSASDIGQNAVGDCVDAFVRDERDGIDRDAGESRVAAHAVGDACVVRADIRDIGCDDGLVFVAVNADDAERAAREVGGLDGAVVGHDVESDLTEIVGGGSAERDCDRAGLHNLLRCGVDHFVLEGARELLAVVVVCDGEVTRDATGGAAGITFDGHILRAKRNDGIRRGVDALVAVDEIARLVERLLRCEEPERVVRRAEHIVGIPDAHELDVRKHLDIAVFAALRRALGVVYRRPHRARAVHDIAGSTYLDLDIPCRGDGDERSVGIGAVTHKHRVCDRESTVLIGDNIRAVPELRDGCRVHRGDVVGEDIFHDLVVDCVARLICVDTGEEIERGIDAVHTERSDAGVIESEVADKREPGFRRERVVREVDVLPVLGSCRLYEVDAFKRSRVCECKVCKRFHGPVLEDDIDDIASERAGADCLDAARHNRGLALAVVTREDAVHDQEAVLVVLGIGGAVECVCTHREDCRLGEVDIRDRIAVQERLFRDDGDARGHGHCFGVRRTVEHIADDEVARRRVHESGALKRVGGDVFDCSAVCGDGSESAHVGKGVVVDSDDAFRQDDGGETCVDESPARDVFVGRGGEVRIAVELCAAVSDKHLSEHDIARLCAEPAGARDGIVADLDEVFEGVDSAHGFKRSAIRKGVVADFAEIDRLGEVDLRDVGVAGESARRNLGDRNLLELVGDYEVFLDGVSLEPGDCIGVVGLEREDIGVEVILRVIGDVELPYRVHRPVVCDGDGVERVAFGGVCPAGEDSCEVVVGFHENAVEVGKRKGNLLSVLGERDGDVVFGKRCAVVNAGEGERIDFAVGVVGYERRCLLQRGGGGVDGSHARGQRACESAAHEPERNDVALECPHAVERDGVAVRLRVDACVELPEVGAGGSGVLRPADQAVIGGRIVLRLGLRNYAGLCHILRCGVGGRGCAGPGDVGGSVEVKAHADEVGREFRGERKPFGDVDCVVHGVEALPVAVDEARERLILWHRDVGAVRRKEVRVCHGAGLRTDVGARDGEGHFLNRRSGELEEQLARECHAVVGVIDRDRAAEGPVDVVTLLVGNHVLGDGEADIRTDGSCIPRLNEHPAGHALDIEIGVDDAAGAVEIEPVVSRRDLGAAATAAAVDGAVLPRGVVTGDQSCGERERHKQDENNQKLPTFSHKTPLPPRAARV